MSRLDVLKAAVNCSPKAMAMIVEEAFELVAKTNNQPVNLAHAAYVMGVPNVVNQVDKLVALAVEATAKTLLEREQRNETNHD